MAGRAFPTRLSCTLPTACTVALSWGATSPPPVGATFGPPLPFPVGPPWDPSLPLSVGADWPPPFPLPLPVGPRWAPTPDLAAWDRTAPLRPTTVHPSLSVPCSCEGSPWALSPPLPQLPH